MTATATYSKLNNGTWGVRVPGQVSEGATVTVTKRDGRSKVETVARILWTGADNRTGQTVSLCAIAQSSTPAPVRGATTSVPRSTRSTVGGWTCTDRAGCRCHDCL